MADEPIERLDGTTTWATTKAFPPPIGREDIFNEVIYGLGVLLLTIEHNHSEDRPGVKLALDYVKAMVEAEA